MRITLLTDAALPGAFMIEAETPEECLILRIFGNDRRPILIASRGGNIAENQERMIISHAEATRITEASVGVEKIQKPIHALENETSVDDMPMDGLRHLLEAIPACELHGSFCIQHAIAWV